VRTPYDLMSVAQTYRAANTQSEFVKDHLAVVARYVNGQLARRSPVKALDVGCGAGASFKLLNDRLINGGLDYVGIDESKQQIGLAINDHAANHNARFMLGSAEALPFADGHFDTVFECRLFQFVVDPFKILAEMVRTSRDLVIATIYTYEQTLSCFHPFYTYFEMDNDRRIVSGAEALRELNVTHLVTALLRRDGNRYSYPFAKQRRTLPAHAELDDFVARFRGRLVHRQVVTQELDTIISPNGGDTGPTQEGDRRDYPAVRRQTLVLAKQR
jgi:ubiquinone/menaquinone biosynthesis C-methylase UbiE